MKKSRIIIPSIMIILYFFLAFLPQEMQIGGKDVIIDIFLKMLIAIIAITIYFVVRFHKKGLGTVLINTLAIPVCFEIVFLLLAIFTGNVIYGYSISVILYILAFIVYYTMYMYEINKPDKKQSKKN
ncbi:MAG: hypothetical protein ACI4VE_05425 [Clostridia bacterium]